MAGRRSLPLRKALLISAVLLVLPALSLLLLGQIQPVAPRTDAAPAVQRAEPALGAPSAPGSVGAASARAEQAGAASPAPAEPEARLVERMHAALAEGNADEVLRLDSAAERAHPGGARATERGMLRVRALALLGRVGEARGVARELAERYPEDPHAQSAASFMGVHARPRGPSR